jgi:hypothetical protein
MQKEETMDMMGKKHREQLINYDQIVITEYVYAYCVRKQTKNRA